MPYKDKEKQRAAKRESDNRHREKCRAYSRKYYAENKETESIKSKAWRDENKEYRQNKRFEYLYGINIEQYNDLFDVQNGKCAICGKHQSELDKRLYVDHDHETSAVRGLLCQKCNTALGMLGDNLDLLWSAIEYLEGTIVLVEANYVA